MDPEYVAFALVSAVVVAGFLLGVPQGGTADEDAVGAPGSAHLHAHLFVVLNGSEKAFDARYIERDARAHFHSDDSILHVEAENVDLGYALEALEISVNRSCVAFPLEERTRCGAVGVRVNGAPVSFREALNRNVRQGDSIVVWYGQEPEDDYDRKLPPEYREPTPGKSV